MWPVGRIYDSPWALPFLRRNEIAVPVGGIGNRPMNWVGRCNTVLRGDIVAGAALCLGRRVGHRASFPHATFRPSAAPLRRVPLGAYCRYAEHPAVADAVSLVVAAVVAENEGVRRS